MLKPMAFSLLKKHVGSVFRAGPAGALDMKSISTTNSQPNSGLFFKAPANLLAREGQKASSGAPIMGAETASMATCESLSLTEALARLDARIQSLDDMQRRLSYVMSEVSASIRRI